MKLKKTVLAVLACALSLVFAFAFAACTPAPKDPTVESVVLDVTTVTMGPGDTQRLTATVTLTDGTKGEVDEWTTSAESVATVTRGVVAAKAAGTATITAKAGDKTATCAVTVEDITVELDKATLALERGSEGQLAATVKKNGAAVTETVDWTSSDELVATVDSTGKVTAVGEGTATVTATRHGANQKATCAVTVTWTKPAGYEAIEYYEQNKVPTNKWGYWNDPANYVGGKSEMIEAYYQNSTAGSEAGKINFTFRVDERDGGANNSSIIQITYRSAEEQEGGKLKVNHNYKLDFTLTSSVAGKIEMNTIGKDPKPEATDIVAGENNLSVQFRHGDWGVIYPEGVYDNVESAAFFLLGLLGEPGETVTVSIDKLHWTDLGESEEKTEKPDFTPTPVELPDLSGVEAIALDISTDNAKYDITTADEGKTYNVVYTGTVNNTYENISVAIPEGANAANCNTFAVTIKNNGESSMVIRFDINGSSAHGTNNVLDIVKASVATEGTPDTNLEWGGTALTVAAGATVTLYLTYDANTESGAPTSILIYFDTAWASANNEHSGSVTLSQFKFANVTAAD